jgi:hypothetical protein
MGMFDTILCKRKLPLSELLEELKVDWKNQGFQTKDLDCSMALYEITEEGTLNEEVLEREYICYTEEELQTMQPKPWSPYKEILIKNKYMKPVMHHGIINFYDVLNYTDTQDIWVEFNAYFIYGKLDKIELFKAEFHESYAVSSLRWQEEREAEEKLLWNRTKKVLNRVGWRWFWYKAAKGCHNLQNLLSKLQTLIYRKIA